MPRRRLIDLSDKQLEKVLDKWFSRFIRLRDSDNDGQVRCCTCGRLFYWKNIHNGHFSKRNLAHRFNEKNCNAQCNYCNTYLKGEADKHAYYIDSKHGDGTAEYLRGTEKKIRKYFQFEYLELIDIYKNKVKELSKEKGIPL